jgi:type II secretory ATPase GspE/PulE/Tfp pilus assembly ATPase PilB-like protein
LHELLVGTDEIKQLIQSRTSTSGMLNAGIHSGMRTLLGDGIRKVVQGLTTYRQVRAVASK